MTTIRQIIGTIVLVVVVWGQAINGRFTASRNNPARNALALPQAH